MQAMTTQPKKLIRKQFLISSDQIKKLERLAKKEKTSAAEMVRNAIDAYDPDVPGNMDESELLALVSMRLKETIEETKTTRLHLDKTLKALSEGAA